MRTHTPRGQVRCLAEPWPSFLRQVPYWKVPFPSGGWRAEAQKVRRKTLLEAGARDSGLAYPRLWLALGTSNLGKVPLFMPAHCPHLMLSDSCSIRSDFASVTGLLSSGQRVLPRLGTAFVTACAAVHFIMLLTVSLPGRREAPRSHSFTWPLNTHQAPGTEPSSMCKTHRL